MDTKFLEDIKKLNVDEIKQLIEQYKNSNIENVDWYSFELRKQLSILRNNKTIIKKVL